MSYVREIFEDNKEEYMKFENVSTRLSNKADVNALMLLDKLVPGISRIIMCANGNELVFDVSEGMLVEANVQKDDILDLIRCGIVLDTDDYLYMYV